MFETGQRYLWAAPDGANSGAIIGASGGFQTTRREEAAVDCQPHLLLICKSNLERECLYNGLLMNGLKLPIITHGTIKKDISLDGVVVIVLHIGSRRLADALVSDEIRAAIKSWYPIPVVLLAEREDWLQVIRAIELGARGYIPTSVDAKICVEAIHLAMAGGIYVPASLLKKSDKNESEDDVLGGLFTPREIEVVNAIRVGKSNKIIAFELKMSEGTVKAHVHNIMKKIGASNRTEVACKLHKLYGANSMSINQERSDSVSEL
ncbi:LuxR C-terminal-related transcriptional regulator [Falsochrobactrum ovis]|uniref:DNA-binding NarL/FixJ family response regulator n=1 Tax=Falsochrobactrum ovis TaxID=1293442 RepID=A0A364JZX7_9HYPH|nr:response regulator transcription factor [Falsochrobactrum ovis]RAK34089.1 DNA-binding NarL/FixJ family response regulator [Falsochrobactrum ovis]